MTADVFQLGAHENMTPEQALSHCLMEKLKGVIIIGYDSDGEFVVRSSHMDRKEALWLIELARHHILSAEIEP